MTLPGGWRVLEPIGDPRRTTAVRYQVERKDGERAFLRASDFSRAMGTTDVLLSVREIADHFLHHRELVEITGSMDKIVRGLDAGRLPIEGSELGVMYLIFELADGDVRDRLARTEAHDQMWRLRVLHEAAQALQQLHVRRIYHQNVKPGHVLNVGEGIKLGDLSAASHGDRLPPLVSESLPGDAAYAAPECLYGFEYGAGNPDQRRQARDMYLFGSLILFLYAQVTTTTAILAELDFAHHPEATSEPYEMVLPHLQEAFDHVAEHLEQDTNVPGELVVSFRELCQPDPRRRGHPRSRSERHGSPYSLERYISRLGVLRKRAEFDGIR
jgi:eukaryotic-like serine/threonine-protein kinase